MRAVRLIAAFEFRDAVQRRSFWLMTLLFPLLILALSLGATLAGGEEASLEEALAPAGEPRGLVDQSGLVEGLPPDVPPAALPLFEGLDDARAALARGAISGFVVIPADYLESGRLVLVQDDLELLSPDPAGPLVEYVLGYALTGDPAVAAALVEPVSEVELVTAGGDGAPARPGGEASGDEAASSVAGLLPMAVLFVLFFVITTSSGYLLQSVAREKENRTAEVLLVTITPRQLMAGKVLGLGGVALVQVAVWVGAGVLAVSEVAGVVDLGSAGLSSALVSWILAFVLLGYVAYGAILAALGALVPSQREGSQLMFVVLVPLLVPLWFNAVLIEEPDGWLSLALSLFPLSAPVAMTTRLATGDIPLWQPLLALAGLGVTAYLFVLLGARILSAGTLLSSESLSWRRLRGALQTALRSR